MQVNNLNFPVDKISHNWFSVLAKVSSGERIFIYITDAQHIKYVFLNFPACTYRVYNYLLSEDKPWPFLEGASGLSTLLYAIQLEF